MYYKFRYFLMSSIYPVTIMIGTMLPILFFILFTNTTLDQVPKDYHDLVKWKMFFIFIPMILLMYTLNGYVSNTAIEKQKSIPFRLKLFGINENMGVCYKIISNFIIIVCSIILYTIVANFNISLNMDFIETKYFGLYGVLLVITYFIFLILGQGIVNITNSENASIGIGMFLYFLISIFSGMYGEITLPKWMDEISKLCPIYYLTGEYINVTQNSNYNYAPMIQSYMVFAGIVVIFYYVSIKWKKQG